MQVEVHVRIQIVLIADLTELCMRVFAIYQILFGWETCKYYYKTDELPNPRRTQPQEKLRYMWHLGHFFFTQQIFFARVGIDFI